MQKPKEVLRLQPVGRDQMNNAKFREYAETFTDRSGRPGKKIIVATTQVFTASSNSIVHIQPPNKLEVMGGCLSSHTKSGSPRYGAPLSGVVAPTWVGHVSKRKV